jgi:hypothetical protein
MHVTRISAATLLLALAAAAGAARANSFYLGGSVGEGIEGGEIRSQSTGGLEASGADETFRVFGGLGLGRHVALEVAYNDFGERSVVPVADFGYDLDLSGFSGSVLGIVPVGRFNLFGKAGFLRWTEEGTLLTIAGPRASSQDGSDLLLGAGVTFDLAERFGLRAEWERYDFDTGAEDALLGGVEVRF